MVTLSGYPFPIRLCLKPVRLSHSQRIWNEVTSSTTLSAYRISGNPNQSEMPPNSVLPRPTTSLTVKVKQPSGAYWIPAIILCDYLRLSHSSLHLWKCSWKTLSSPSYILMIGSGPTKAFSASFLANSSAISFPLVPTCPSPSRAWPVSAEQVAAIATHLPHQPHGGPWCHNSFLEG